MSRLRIQTPSQERYEIELPPQGIRIGRSRRCALRLQARSVSLQHAEIIVDAGETFVVDTNSTNGIVINGKLLPSGYRSLLRDGDVFEVGTYTLTFLQFSSEEGVQDMASIAKTLAREMVDIDGSISLTILHGPQAGVRCEIAWLQEECLIGRGEECHLALVDAGASRRHARLVSSTEGVYIEDLGSRHGTKLQGKLLRRGERALLHDRDELVIGNTSIVFSDPEEALLRASVSKSNATEPTQPLPKAQKLHALQKYLLSLSLVERACFGAASLSLLLAILFATMALVAS